MSFRLYLPIIGLLSLACSTSALAKGVSLTADGAVAYALKHNPALAAARLSIEEARGRLKQSGRLSNPELELEFNKNTRSRESSASVVLMQRFPVTARLRYEKAVSRAQLSAAESEVRDAERKLSADVRTLAVKLVALNEQRSLRSTQLATTHELSEFLRKLVATGEGSSTDALQVELELRQIEIEKLQLTAEEMGLLGEFQTLLGTSPTELPTVSGKLTPPSGDRKSSDLAERPDILAAQSRAEAAQLSVLEQQARRLEDVGAGISYQNERRIDDPNPMQREQIIGLRFSLPLPLWNNNSGRIHEATAAAGRAEKELSSVRFTAGAEVLAARNAMDAYSKILVELDSKVLPRATQLEEQLQMSYSNGHTPLTEVLRARSRHLDLQRQRLDALRDYHLASIRYVSATNQQPASK
jgi:cobalt-zinc-cadmium efflux system outer membrane protein